MLDFARHYGTSILPARPYHPQDKAKVESAVQIVERWIMARLRHQQFASMHEVNNAIMTRNHYMCGNKAVIGKSIKWKQLDAD